MAHDARCTACDDMLHATSCRVTVYAWFSITPRVRRPRQAHYGRCVHTEIPHVYGFDSVRISFPRGEILQHAGDFPRNFAQRILASRILVQQMAVCPLREVSIWKFGSSTRADSCFQGVPHARGSPKRFSTWASQLRELSLRESGISRCASSRALVAQGSKLVKTG